MTAGLSIILMIVSLLGCIILKIDLICGLLAGMFLLMAAAVRSGSEPRQVLRMMLNGIRESLIVVRILLIIGAMTGIWRGCGTIPLLVDYGTRLIHPKLFILCAFLLCAAVSYLIGTSLGTAATIGVVMMTLSAVSGGDPLLTAGAVFSGIYFGDRASPASSSAHLNAYLTKTEIYRNVGIMLRDCVPAALITTGLYTLLSFLRPLRTVDTGLIGGLRESFSLSPLLLLPALVILAAPLVRMNIRYAMGISILCGAVLACAVQRMPFTEMLGTLLTGYKPAGEYTAMLGGGGVSSMVHSCVMIMISATYSGIFNGTNMLASAEKKLEKLADRTSPYRVTLLTSIPVIMFSCNQTLAMMLHAPLIRPVYEKHGVNNDKMMLDLANTTILFAAVVPWCLACSVPMDTLQTGYAAVPLGFYLYMPALVTLFRDLRQKKTADPAVSK